MAVVTQQTQNLHEFSSELHMTWKPCVIEFKTQLVASRARTICWVGRNAGTSTIMMKVPKSDGFMSWTVFHHQFKGMDDHNSLTTYEKARWFCWGSCQHPVQWVPHWERHMETSYRVLKGPNRYYQLEVFYQSQLKARIKLNGEPLQEIAAGIEQLALRPFSCHLRTSSRESQFMHLLMGVKDQEMKQHLVMGHKRLTNIALKQVLKWEAAKAAAGPSKAVGRARAPMETWSNFQE